MGINQEKQFENWLKKHQGIIIKITRSFSQTSDDFNDLYQEILIQIWKSVLVFRNESSESTWIYRVALNKAILWKKRESKRKGLIKIVQLESHYRDIKASDTTDQVEYLYEGIRQLNKADRSLILLVLDGLSHREISKIINTSESNIGVRVHRIKKKLVELIKKTSHEF
ncbi:RNA polymerase sigma factor [Cognatitamlana onchidii]|uniref:RNA polymerase sigma factor n=1 Tax=Cognatitamlana onchidii TaxID=2562860 RepID=UPI0010A68EB0|nr:RNA polymerase sigma factor [Algibacter onchidii]